MEETAQFIQINLMNSTKKIYIFLIVIRLQKKRHFFLKKRLQIRVSYSLKRLFFFN